MRICNIYISLCSSFRFRQAPQSEPLKGEMNFSQITLKQKSICGVRNILYTVCHNVLFHPLKIKEVKKFFCLITKWWDLFEMLWSPFFPRWVGDAFSEITISQKEGSRETNETSKAIGCSVFSVKIGPPYFLVDDR